ncbi:hypothetical protein CSB08_01380 [Candidatus Gracilibacteria bacterium]|nr:MAG: hypothetical protein CSB08_01380 [Candidatus Gracilibacteria bacterium]PIE85379.1 MAG: hypothetical protein CSA08_02265 [Candidatus Gracilibacteria bacterium]
MSVLNKKNKEYFLNLENNSNVKNKFFDKINQDLNKEKLIIISGIEGVGKTEIVSSYIKSINKTNATLYFNTDIDIYGKIKEKKDLEKMIEFYIKDSEEPEFIILENIQKVLDVDLFIKDLFLSKKYKIILIGNNIKVFGKPEIEILPDYSSKAYKSELDNILKYGILTEKEETDSKKEYLLESITNRIILNDIIYAFEVRNIKLFKSFTAVLATNNDYISLRDFQKILKRYNIKTSLATTIDYMEYLISSKIIKKVAKYNVKKGKEILGKNKYFFTDIGIKNSILLYNNMDNYTLTENYIYNVLSYLGYKVYGGINGVFNFNFIAFKENTKILIYISKDSSNNDEIKSSARKLIKTGIEGKKYIIVNNNKNLNIRENYKGVEIIKFNDFLKVIN